MEFDFDDAQRGWHDEAARFALDELDDPAGTRHRDESGTFWREGWQACGRLGILGLPVSEQDGGRGGSLTETVAAMEGLGFGCPDSGLIFGINSCLWTVTLPIAKFGTAEQRRRWLPGLCDGSIVGANAASEPEAGSDIYAMAARAERRDDRWVLNGRKVWITCGPVADVAICYASTDPDRGIFGISAFIVPADTPGFRVARTIPKMGTRTAPMGELVFEDCAVPPDALLGKVGRGAKLFSASMEWERGAILGYTLGTMRRQLERCVEHARARRQFGQPIAKNQAVAHRIVQMKLRLETCRPLVYRAARLMEQGRDATMESAMAKLHVSECFVANSLDAVRTFGARGYAAESGMERDLRDSVGGLIYSGTNDIQKNIIAQRLRLG